MPNTIKQHMHTREWGMLITLSILWGGSFFFNGIAVTELPPLTIVALRVGLAAIALWLFVLLSGLSIPKESRIWRAFLGMGILNNAIPFTLIVWGQTHIASGLASILNATTPLFTVVVASLLLNDEKATALKLIGVMIGFIGVVIMVSLPAIQIGSSIWPHVAILCASISYAFAGVYGRRFKTLKVNPIVVTAGQVTASSCLLAPLSLYIDSYQPLLNMGGNTVLAIMALAILSTATAYVLYFKLLAAAGATNVLLVTLLVPVSAILLGVIFLNEALQPIHFIGMGLIALGFSAIDGRVWKNVNVKK